MIVILGHPRSGTGYMAALLQSVGWDVGHERLGRDGISSWMWAVQADEVPWGDARGQHSLEGDTVLHVVRDPAEVVASVAHTEQGSEAWRARWVRIPNAKPIERAVWSLAGWQRLIEEQGARQVRIDDAEAAVQRVTGRELRTLRDGASRNARRHRRYKRRDIERGLSREGLRLWGEVCERWEGLASR